MGFIGARPNETVRHKISYASGLASGPRPGDLSKTAHLAITALFVPYYVDLRTFLYLRRQEIAQG